MGRVTLSGQLEDINIASVLQNLFSNNSTGLLRLKSGQPQSTIQQCFLFIDNQAIEIVMPLELQSARTLPKDQVFHHWQSALGPILVRMGLMTEHEKKSVLESSKKPGQDVVAKYKKLKNVDADSVRAALRFLQEEALYELLTWDKGEFAFELTDRDHEDIPKAFRKESLRLNPNSVLMEAARRSDEMSRISAEQGDFSGVYMAQGSSDGLDERNQRIFELLDGCRDLPQLIEDSGWLRFWTVCSLAELSSLQKISPVRADDHVRLGQQSEQHGDVETTVFHYRRAVAMRRTDSRTRRQLAQILADAGDFDEAATQYVVLADIQSERKDFDAAFGAYQSALELRPKDIALREKYFESLLASQRTEPAIACGEALTQVLIDMGLRDKAHAVFERLKHIPGFDSPRVERAQAQNLDEMGQREQAVELYARLARQHLKRSLDQEARVDLMAALKIDDQRADLQKILDDIETGRLIERQKMWRSVRRWTAFLAVLAAVGCWLIYDFRANSELSEILDKGIEQVFRGQKKVFVERLKKHSEDYPWTRSAFQARRTLKIVKALKRKPRARLRTMQDLPKKDQ